MDEAALEQVSSMKCIRFDVCKDWTPRVDHARAGSSMKCIRFDVCKFGLAAGYNVAHVSSMKCIRFDVCKISPLAAFFKPPNPQ